MASPALSHHTINHTPGQHVGKDVNCAIRTKVQNPQSKKCNIVPNMVQSPARDHLMAMRAHIQGGYYDPLTHRGLSLKAKTKREIATTTNPKYAELKNNVHGEPRVFHSPKDPNQRWQSRRNPNSNRQKILQARAKGMVPVKDAQGRIVGERPRKHGANKHFLQLFHEIRREELQKELAKSGRSLVFKKSHRTGKSVMVRPHLDAAQKAAVHNAVMARINSLKGQHTGGDAKHPELWDKTVRFFEHGVHPDKSHHRSNRAKLIKQLQQEIIAKDVAHWGHFSDAQLRQATTATIEGAPDHAKKSIFCAPAGICVGGRPTHLQRLPHGHTSPHTQTMTLAEHHEHLRKKRGGGGGGGGPPPAAPAAAAAYATPQQSPSFNQQNPPASAGQGTNYLNAINFGI